MLSEQYDMVYFPQDNPSTPDLGPGSGQGLLAARKCAAEERGDLLRRADLELDRLRYTVRLCHEVGVFGQNQYRHASGLLAEVGRLVGKWMQRYNR